MNSAAKKHVQRNSSTPLVLMADLNVRTDRLVTPDTVVLNSNVKARELFSTWSETSANEDADNFSVNKIPQRMCLTSYKKTWSYLDAGWSQPFDKIALHRSAGCKASLVNFWQPDKPEDQPDLEARREMSDHCPVTSTLDLGDG